jgi:uncharacterized protein YndB with AHSA1/START domain
MTGTDVTHRRFTLEWTLDATPAEVFRAWTDPDHLDWYYNDHQPIPEERIEVDLRVGGVWRQRMVISPDTQFVTGGIYREIVADERLVFTWGAVDGWPRIDPEQLDESPRVTVTLVPVGDQTEMSVRVELPASLSEEQVREWWSMGVKNGWRHTVDRLAVALSRAAAR